MKEMGNGGAADLFKSSTLVKISGFILVSVVFFYLGKHFSDGSSQQLVFFSSHRNPDHNEITGPPSSVALSPNHNKFFNITSLTNDTSSVQKNENKEQESIGSVSPPPNQPPPPPAPAVKRMGVVDENGVMAEDFEVGEFDTEVVENWGKANDTANLESHGKGGKVRVRVNKFPLCPESMREYIPCLDNEEAIKKLKSTEKGENFERHCPEKGKELNCLVPSPKGYQTPIPWPQSRDEVWFSNVPHARLAEDKGGQNWITIDKDKFKFPGGGTQFIHGADQYLDQIEKMIPEIAFGHHTRVTLDVGCGVASFGAYLLSRNVTTLSVAPKDVHENQIQFALERGVPAMVAAFATRRLLYPSQAFDLVHCSRCRINWTRDEIKEFLGNPNKSIHPLNWQLRSYYIFFCYEAVQMRVQSRLCIDICSLSIRINLKACLDSVADYVRYVDLKACITRLPEEGYGSNITTWPARLHNPPDRLQSIQIDAYMSRNELFRAESIYWKELIESYVRALHWKKFKLRNVLDMRAGFGGFAAALIENQLDCWVLNVVPVSGPNTLPVIYDRGLIGVIHDWCEPFDTYPRTYDLLHAAGLFSIEQKRCNISTIMLEMDRILRPGGRVYIRDSLAVMDELEEIATAMGWHVSIRDTSEGPHASYRILTGDKRLLQA
ncbi:probable methyltransferase PMT11 [Olea europaea subsp. europaea]|uniref:Methyltransferase n=1 Tax=Olea europaea subsp. europaea TaxID=158383 RepID=A0A8S0SM86_OLEEU|nr:probable methyltransferase PMT11 [Olea europaea subsp. europaea]